MQAITNDWYEPWPPGDLQACTPFYSVVSSRRKARHVETPRSRVGGGCRAGSRLAPDRPCNPRLRIPMRCTMRSRTTRLNCPGLKQPAARMQAIHKDKHARRTIAAVAIALCAGLSQLAVAQDPKGLNIDVGNCVALEKPDERLACFEAQVEAARQRAASSTASEATGAGAGAITGATAGVGAGASAAATGAAERGPSSGSGAAPVGPGTAPPAMPEGDQRAAVRRKLRPCGAQSRAQSRASADRNRRDGDRAAPDGSQCLT